MGAGSDKLNVLQAPRDVGRSRRNLRLSTAPTMACRLRDECSETLTVTDIDGHHHMPTPADLKLIGDRDLELEEHPGPF